MNRSNRMLAIALLLSEQQYTAEQLAQQLEVSRRTILRDIQALCEAGVPVIAREGVGGGYSLPAEYHLQTPALNNSETFLLLLALRNLGQQAPFASEYASLQAKISSVLHEPQRQQADHLLSIIRQRLPQQGPVPYLDDLVQATHQQQWLRIHYQSAQQLTWQHIFPRQIELLHGIWYCRAYSHERAEDRTYRIDRIRELSLATQQFAVPAAPAPYSHEQQAQMHVKLSPQGARWMESEPELSHQLQRHADGSAELQLHFPPSELDWYARYFLSFGIHAYVHAPEQLRERIAELAQQALDQYRTDDKNSL